MNRIRDCCSAIVLSLAVHGLAAQAPLAPVPGDRVRVTSFDGSRRAKGTLESIAGDTIVLRHANGALIKFARGPRTRLDVSAGPGMCGEGRRATCVIGGFLGGGLVGLGAGAIAAQSCTGEDLCGLVYLVTVPAGALVGTLVGTLIGGERWRKYDFPVNVGFGPPGASRIALGVTLKL